MKGERDWMGRQGKARKGLIGKRQAGIGPAGSGTGRDGAASMGKWMWIAAFALLLSLQIMTIFYFGERKTGFHEDEYYSFYSTNRTAGLYEPDREWVERDAFRNEFVVLQGERFRYGLVATVQSWDVHPPFFYFMLHTVCSFFPGVFSKWLGIGLNMVAFCLNFCLLSWLAYMVGGGNKWLAWVVTAVHGFNPVIISGVMFIRMYEWLTVFVLLCACLHVREVKSADRAADGEWVKKFLLPLMAVNYLGFLTQYYYLIFLFFMAVGFCLWNLLHCVGKDKGRGVFAAGKGQWKERILRCVWYGCACGASLLFAVVSYPACLSHILRGYRGTGAVSEFLDPSNTGGRLGFFAGLMNEYLFDGYLWHWIGAIVLLGCLVWIQGKRGCKNGKGSKGKDGRERDFWEEGGVFFLLLFAVCGYFFTVSKTALLLYETSNRYQLPVYGILILLVITVAYRLWERLVRLFCEGQRAERLAAAGGAGLLFLLLVGDVHEINAGKMIFLYEEEKADVEYARGNANMPVVILYNDTTPYHVWWLSQELMEYNRLYFVSAGNKERIVDDIICNSDKIIVYAADYDTQRESLELILESNPALDGYRLVSQKSLWSVYEFE